MLPGQTGSCQHTCEAALASTAALACQPWHSAHQHLALGAVHVPALLFEASEVGDQGHIRRRWAHAADELAQRHKARLAG